MECSAYAPLLSRYVDDDLEPAEAEQVLQHLSSCPQCQKELEVLERLRAWLHSAHSFEQIPEVQQEQFILHALESWDIEEGEQVAAGQPPAWSHLERLKKSAEGSRRSMWKPLDALLGVLPSPGIWRFALPLVVVAVGVFLWMSRDQRKTVDVRNLPAPAPLIASVSQQETDETDFYVLEHTSQQPWSRYGDEVPVIQLVSDSVP